MMTVFIVPLMRCFLTRMHCASIFRDVMESCSEHSLTFFSTTSPPPTLKEAGKRTLSQRGDTNRPDYVQVCIGLVVSREGLPLAFEVFDGNRTDVTTVEEMVEKWKRNMVRLEGYGSWIGAWLVKTIFFSCENEVP